MNPTVELDMRSFNESVKRLKSVNKRETTDFLRRLAKELLKYLVRLTPPFGKHAFTETFGTQLKVGREAVAHDVRRGFEPMNDLDLLRAPTGKLGLDIQKLIRKGDLHMATILAKAQGLRFAGFIDRVDSKAHQRLRNRKGRVTAPSPFIVIKSASVGQRIRKAEKMVGYAKSGWMVAAKMLKVWTSYPQWIRSKNAPGAYSETGAGGTNFKIRMENKVQFGFRFETSIAAAALRKLKGSVEAQYTALINRRHKRRGTA